MAETKPTATVAAARASTSVQPTKKRVIQFHGLHPLAVF